MVERSILSSEVCRDIDNALTKFPATQKRSAVLAALTSAQHHNHGFLTVEIMDAVAEYIGLAKIAVYEVASFYSMYETKPVAKNSISVCTNISCMLRGAEDIVAHLESRLNARLGESSADGKFYLKREEECLAGCCGAPMMQINHKYYENLTPEKVDKILEQF